MQAFRLPLAAKRHGSRVSLWGLVRPAAGTTTAVVLVADAHKAFHKLRTVTTNARGYWRFTTATAAAAASASSGRRPTARSSAARRSARTG